MNETWLEKKAESSSLEHLEHAKALLEKVLAGKDFPEDALNSITDALIMLEEARLICR